MIPQHLFIALLMTCYLPLNAAAATMQMDAAQENRYGATFSGFAAVRPIIDNRQGKANLTNVRFKIEIHSGTLGGIGGWTWDNTDNPWYGARSAVDFTPGGAKYTQGIVYYPQSQKWAPYFSVDPTPGNPDDRENDYEIFDAVPVGIRWDHCVKISGWLGEDIELFSTAEGSLSSTQVTETLYDTDPGPQTAPEPAILSILLVVGVSFLRQRR